MILPFDGMWSVTSLQIIFFNTWLMSVTASLKLNCSFWLLQHQDPYWHPLSACRYVALTIQACMQKVVSFESQLKFLSSSRQILEWYSDKAAPASFTVRYPPVSLPLDGIQWKTLWASLNEPHNRNRTLSSFVTYLLHYCWCRTWGLAVTLMSALCSSRSTSHLPCSSCLSQTTQVGNLGTLETLQPMCNDRELFFSALIFRTFTDISSEMCK
jgi:hypothetical protein